jgi:phosphotransferase system HPr-like phosphotransfer protein
MIDSDVDLVYHHYILDAKSIMAIFSIDLSGDLKLVLHSENEDEIRRFDEILEGLNKHESNG